VRISPMAIPDAYRIEPEPLMDSRGHFYESVKNSALLERTGRGLTVRQVNFSVSKRNTLRGIHGTKVPPGQAKFVTCVRGRALDIAVDIRVGSPTFGRWDAVVLDDHSRISVYLSEGLAHGFLALQDNSTVMYLCSAEYNPQGEHTISPTDPALAIDWPSGHELVISDRDAAAPTLDEVRAAGLLPSWDEARAFVEGLKRD
jgi:dTDP-4-dehydrorhamnose 3,5-epimerase